MMSHHIVRSLREKAGTFWLEILSRRRKEKINRETDAASVNHLKPAVNIVCRWYGTSYGGFYIIADWLNESSVIYSFGIGKDVSFDLECIRRHGSPVCAFDPTPKAIEWIARQKLPEKFHFYPYGISASVTGETDFYLPANPRGVSGSIIKHREVDSEKAIKVMMKTFEDIIGEMKHTHIDVLKMDIEGSEYEVLDSVLRSHVTVDQILVEFHDRNFDTDVPRSREAVRRLYNKGYHIYACSDSYEEVSFVHERRI
jgi:FkbM family methyltransferase